jgi:hypothetical protein
MNDEPAYTGEMDLSCGGADPELCRACLAQPPCAAVLRFLNARPTTVMTLPDIAGDLGLTTEVAQFAIDTLDRMGFLREVRPEDSLTFYGITDDGAKGQAVKDFLAWCNQQREYWQGLRRVIG